MRRVLIALVVAAVGVSACTGASSAEGSSSASGAQNTLGSKTSGRFVHQDRGNGFSIRVAPGWTLSSAPLRPWLASPHELLSAATVPLAPSRRPGNQAACPSEVAQVVVDQIGRDGGYFSLDEGFTGGPRPDHAADLDWRRGCALPQGMTVEIATFRDAERDFVVTTVFGPSASKARRADLYAMLDSLEFR